MAPLIKENAQGVKSFLGGLENKKPPGLPPGVLPWPGLGHFQPQFLRGAQGQLGLVGGAQALKLGHETGERLAGLKAEIVTDSGCFGNGLAGLGVDDFAWHIVISCFGFLFWRVSRRSLR